MPKIFSEELGLEDCPERADLTDHATVVIAVLRDGIEHPPRHCDEITHVYCPTCGWLDPQAGVHMDDCREDGRVLM